MTTDTSLSKPIGLRWRSHTAFICATVGVGAFSDLFLYALIVPVLPFMLKDRIQIPESQIQSTVSALLAIYAGASCLASPVVGILADRFCSSRQLPFLLGLALLLASTILLAVGTSLPVLMIARLLQGASGTTVWTIGMALLIETVGQENLGRTVGTVFSFTTVASLFAPIIGGLLYAKTGYTGVFGVGIAVVAIDLMMRLLMIEKKVAAKYTAADRPKSSGEDHDESSPLLQSRPPQEQSRFRFSPPKHRLTKAFPMLLILSDPAFLTALFIGFIQAILLGAFDATVPLLASSRYGFDSLEAGLLFIPLGGTDLLFGPVFGWCVDRYGTRPIAILGFLWLVPALVLLRLPSEGAVSAHLDKGHEIALYSSLLALSGIGLAIINSTPVVEAGNIVDKYYKANKDLFDQPPYAQLYGFTSMVWCAGLTIGPLIGGELGARVGNGNMNAVLAGFCGVTALLTALFIGRK